VQEEKYSDMVLTLSYENLVTVKAAVSIENKRVNVAYRAENKNSA
jgi:hypothetical protein